MKINKNLDKKKILIIGSQGYLGTFLADYLTKKNYYCEGIDMGYFKHGKISSFTKIVEKKKNASNVVLNDLKKFDVVIQLAAFSNDPVDNLDPKKFYKPTVDYTLKIAKLCKKLGIRFIFPSSCSVYGYGKEIFSEKSKLNPLTHYSKNKAELEKKLLKISDKNFKPIILRLGTVFGFSPRIRFDIVVNMFAGMAITKKEIMLNSNGQSWRPHIHIEDVCKTFEEFINFNLQNYKNIVLNVGIDKNNIKTINLTKIFKKKIKDLKIKFISSTNENRNEKLFLDKKISNKGIDKRSYQVSFLKFKKILPHFKFKYNLNNGILKLITDLKNNNLNKKTFESYRFYRLQALHKQLNKK